jgi:hypothetical protein
MAENVQSLSVYRGWPEKPYKVLGSIRHENPNMRWNDGDIRLAVNEAKRHGGDAIIVRQGAEFGVSKIAGAKNDPLVLSSPYQTTVLVIKWLTEQEIAEQQALIKEWLDRYHLTHPDLAKNSDVGQLVVSYLVQSGLGIRQQETFDKFIGTLSRITSREPASIAGDWIFKAAVSESTAIAAGEERGSLGLASISVEGDNVAIVSKEGKIEVNFSGTLSKGRLQGQVGIGAFTAKCEGAATPDKISISFQSLTPDGMVRGNVVLQRLLPKPNENEKAKPNPAGRSA